LRSVNGEEGAVRAMGELLQAYWRPLYVVARGSGLNQPDAEDAVQSFCHKLVSQESLSRVDRSLGRLRAYLLGAFQNHLHELHRSAQRLKRGGGVQVVALDDPEAMLQMQTVEGESLEHAFDRRWALSLLEQVRQRLRAEYVTRDSASLFETLEPLLAWSGKEQSYAAIGDKLRLTPAAVAQAVKRMRTRYRVLLELEIGETVDGPQAVAEERAYLIRVLSGG
jgi:RNA polymerase sigma-70 factor (ECF subfamily)